MGVYDFKKLKVHSHYVLFLQFASNAKNGFYTHSLRLMQHPIDAMLQFDANANAHTNLDSSVNGPLYLRCPWDWDFFTVKSKDSTKILILIYHKIF